MKLTLLGLGALAYRVTLLPLCLHLRQLDHVFQIWLKTKMSIDRRGLRQTQSIWYFCAYPTDVCEGLNPCDSGVECSSAVGCPSCATHLCHVSCSWSGVTQWRWCSTNPSQSEILTSSSKERESADGDVCPSSCGHAHDVYRRCSDSCHCRVCDGCTNVIFAIVRVTSNVCAFVCDLCFRSESSCAKGCETWTKQTHTTNMSMYIFVHGHICPETYNFVPPLLF